MTEALPVRRVARVIVVDATPAVLLVRHDDPVPADPARPELLQYWVPPGGGAEDHETYEEAARRELHEETGLSLSVGPVLWLRTRTLRRASRFVEQREAYLLARVPSVAPPVANATAETITAHRWWTVDALRATSDHLLPEPFAALIAPVLDGCVPTSPSVI